MEENRILVVEKQGRKARGKKELIEYLKGNSLTLRKAVMAKCYDCMGYFSDEKIDCGVKDCSLYPFMVYNPNRIKGGRGKMSEERKKKFIEIIKKRSDKKILIER